MKTLVSVWLPRFALSAASVGEAVSADNLAVHDKKAIRNAVYRRSACLDCEQTPNRKTERWRFATDIGAPKGFGVAYVVLSFKLYDGTRRAALLSFYPWQGRWRFLSFSLGGTNEFSCGTPVLVDSNVGIDRQVRVLKKVAKF